MPNNKNKDETPDRSQTFKDVALGRPDSKRLLIVTHNGQSHIVGHAVSLMIADDVEGPYRSVRSIKSVLGP